MWPGTLGHDRPNDRAQFPDPPEFDPNPNTTQQPNNSRRQKEEEATWRRQEAEAAERQRREAEKVERQRKAAATRALMPPAEEEEAPAGLPPLPAASVKPEPGTLSELLEVRAAYICGWMLRSID